MTTNTSSYDSAEAALAAVDAGIDAAARRAAAAQAFRRDVVALTGRGTSGSADAVVDAEGLLVDLTLPHNLSMTDGARLRDDILAAVRAARVDVAAQVRAHAETTFGVDSQTTRRLNEDLDTRLIGALPDADPGRGAW